MRRLLRNASQQSRLEAMRRKMAARKKGAAVVDKSSLQSGQIQERGVVELDAEAETEAVPEAPVAMEEEEFDLGEYEQFRQPEVYQAEGSDGDKEVLDSWKLGEEETFVLAMRKMGIPPDKVGAVLEELGFEFEGGALVSRGGARLKPCLIEREAEPRFEQGRARPTAPGLAERLAQLVDAGSTSAALDLLRDALNDGRVAESSEAPAVVHEVLRACAAEGGLSTALPLVERTLAVRMARQRVVRMRELAVGRAPSTAVDIGEEPEAPRSAEERLLIAEQTSAFVDLAKSTNEVILLLEFFERHNVRVPEADVEKLRAFVPS